MRKFTDIFINRPVLAVVVSLLIFVVGLKAIFTLQVREYPKMDNTVIAVTTAYPGASASVVQGFITTPLEQQIAGAEGLDYMTSTSNDGVSTIQAFIRLNYDPEKAFTNVLSEVQKAKQNLPRQAQEPSVEKSTGEQFALMYMAFDSRHMSPEQITNYVSRVVVPELQTVSGVGQVQVLGGRTFAMRIWLDTEKMAGLGVTASDVYAALQSKNVPAAAGHTQGKYIEIGIKPETDLNTVSGFENIVVKEGANGAAVHLKDVSRIKLGSEDYDSSVYFNGEKAVFLGIFPTPTANPLSTITAVRAKIPELSGQFPSALKEKIVWDATRYIRSSINEVIKTIFEATLIVILVIYLFLGSWRTVIIPIITIPLSLIGVAALMQMLGYSLNLLTLLAMVLAIGMVVDDAIVVVENIYRHIEEGLSPLAAALKGASEIATPIITMTITLAAVYTPIGFMGGLTGALFKEFAFTLAAAVVISGIIALTLSPMMCSRFLSMNIGELKFVKFVDSCFEKLKFIYKNLLMDAINYRPATLLFAFVVLLSCYFLYSTSSKELAPGEDQGIVFTIAQGPETATLDYMEKFTNQFNTIYRHVKSWSDYFIVNGANGTNSSFAGLILKPWNERKESQDKVNAYVNGQYQKIPALQIMAIPLPALPTAGSGMPIQFEITSTASLRKIYPMMEKIVSNAQKSGMFMFVFGGLKFDKPEMDLIIDRAKAAQLNIGIDTIAESLATSFGGNYVNWFSMDNQSYQVIPQVEHRFRYNPEDLSKVYVRTGNQNLVSLDTVAKIKYDIEPNSRTRFQQLNSAEISGMTIPGVTIGQGLAYLSSQAKQLLPPGMSYNFAGQSRQYMEEGNALLLTFFFSIIIIYLVLAAQFESFRDPLIIMVSVPMAISGALIGVNIGLATLNIYTQIGLITLIGLISKHGILMVDFAKSLRSNQDISAEEAIVEAASIRLRPILMTTAAMILGVFPLILASGAGAVSRRDIGLVIAMGMLIGTLFTLFVVPVIYTLKTRQILVFIGSVALLAFILSLL